MLIMNRFLILYKEVSNIYNFLSSADNLGKQFGPRSDSLGLNRVQTDLSGLIRVQTV